VEDGERVDVTGQDLDVQRGQLVNYLVRETAEDLDELAEWEEHPDGYVFDEASTTYDDETRTWTVVMVRE
jgi:hypothetical protein